MTGVSIENDESLSVFQVEQWGVINTTTKRVEKSGIKQLNNFYYYIKYIN